MSFWQAIASGFRNYVTFSGRATRSEYWYWVLLTTLIGAATTNLDTANSVFSLITFLPSIAVGVRRLHDIDRTCWWWLLAFTVIGIFVLIFWFCERGTRGPNRYGPDLYNLEDNIKDGAVTAT